MKLIDTALMITKDIAALALHQGGSIHGLEQKTDQLKQEFEQRYANISFDDGVEMVHLPALEVYFKVPINVYSLQQDGRAKVLYLYKLEFEVMHLNLFENHFSYIKHFSKYAKKYTCEICKRIFNQCCHLKRHAKKCSTEIEEIYIGGKYRNKTTIFEELEALEISIPEELRYFSCFDMESLEALIKKEVCSRQICFEHIPATVSICSNIDGHTEAVHLVSDGDTQHLIDSMVEVLLAHKSALCRERYAPYLEALQLLITSIEGEKSDGGGGGEERKGKKRKGEDKQQQQQQRRRQ